MWRIRRFWNNLTRVIAWIPVIWRGTDYDYGFLIRVLNFGMGRLEHHIRHHGISVDRNKNADQIKYTRLLGERLLEWDPSGHMHKHFEEHDRLFRDDMVAFGMGDEERESFRRADKKARYVEERDWNEYWERLRRYARGWWD